MWWWCTHIFFAWMNLMTGIIISVKRLKVRSHIADSDADSWRFGTVPYIERVWPRRYYSDIQLRFSRYHHGAFSFVLCLPNGGRPLERWQDQEGLGSKLCDFGILSVSDTEKCVIRHYHLISLHLMSSAHSARFPKGFQNIIHVIGAVCTAEAFRSISGGCRRVKESWDVLWTMQANCWRCQEVHFRVQILVSTKISMRKF